MNFLETVEKARIKAAEAAKKLSLNEMARNDEYIHSDGLKIKNKHHNSNRCSSGRTSEKKNEAILRNVDESNHEILMMGSNDSRRMSAMSVMNGTNTNTTNSTTISNATIPSRRGINTNHHHHNKSSLNPGFHLQQQQQQHDDEDDDSVDSYDQENDPILQFGKKCNDQMMNYSRTSYLQDANKDRMTFQMQSSNKTSYHQQQQQQQQQQAKKKDPNRFMANLDARLATAPQSSVVTAFQKTISNTDQNNYQSQNKIFDSFTNADNKLNWLRNAVASPTKLQQSFNNVMKQVPGMKHNNYDQVGQNDRGDIEMNMNNNKNPSSSTKTIKTTNGESITVTTSSSSALFDNEENAELERLNQLMNNSQKNICLKGLNFVEKHRNYVLVAVTFILTLVGYWYSVKKNEENVT